MLYKIIGDSCMDLTEELKLDPHFQMIPLTLQIGDYKVTDDETFNQKEFLAKVKASPECPKTACPSPESFKEAFEGEAEYIFVVTLSNHLSGCYNSAALAKRLYEEENGTDGKKIAVIDSLSASAGELNIALFIRDLCEKGLPFEEICRQTEAYRDSMNTYFVIETLDFLKKNGRLTGLTAFIASALNIKPVMGADSGTIIKRDQARGMTRALDRMAEIACKEGGDTASKRLVIAHCNNPERAEHVKEIMCKGANFREVVITNTAGVATVYAGDGGIIMTL